MIKSELKTAVALVVGAYADIQGKANVALFQNLEVFAKGFGPMTEKQWDGEVRPAFEAEIKARNCNALASMLSQIKTFVIAKSHGIVPVKATEGRSLDTFTGYVSAARKPLIACKSARMVATGRNSNAGRPSTGKRQPRQPVAVVKAFSAQSFESMAAFMLDAPHAKELTRRLTDTTARAALVKYLDASK